MDIQIWVGKEYLEQLYKIIQCETTHDDPWSNAVEYTDTPVMPGQIQVSIEYNKYINLTERGLLIVWAGVEI
jgi:hypothetical protein